MKRIELNERLSGAKSRTQTWHWFNESTDESLAMLEANITNMTTEAFSQEYPFSKQAARDWLGLSAKTTAKVDFSAYSKPATPYKKITITFTEGTHESLKQATTYLTDKYGYSTKYCMDCIIRAGIKAVEESKI